MSKNTGGPNDKARKFIAENPTIKSKKAIGVALDKIYPGKNPEYWRAKVREVTGSRGEVARRKIIDPSLTKFFYNGFDKWASENLNTDPQPWVEPFQIPPFKTLPVIADLHSIHLHRDALTAFLRSTKDKEALMINGDLMDSESISRHLKTHNVVAYEKELSICHEVLRGLKQEFTHVYLKEGNHEFWLERYLLTNAREVFKALGVSVRLLLKLDEIGVHHIHNLKYWTYGDLDGCHGHEFPGFGFGKFPARGLLDKWQTFKGKYDVKVLGSHCHNPDQAISPRSKDGKFGYGWITPAMCQKGAHYAPYAGWRIGWTELLNRDGEVAVINKIYE